MPWLSVGRYLLGLAVIGFWLYSNLSEPFKKLVLARADLRIYQANDVVARQQVVAVYNAGETAHSPITVRAICPLTSVTDFSAGPLSTEPGYGFWNALRRSAGLRLLSATRGLIRPAVLDEHYVGRRLDLLAAHFIDKLRRTLGEKHLSWESGHNLIRDGNAHAHWLETCANPQASANVTAQCGVERDFEQVERELAELYQGATTDWEKDTGVRFHLEGGLSGPKQTLAWVWAPEARRGLVLRVRYNEDVGEARIGSDQEDAVQVTSLSDLSAGPWWILFCYRATFCLYGLGFLAGGMWIAWPKLTSPARMETHEIVNLALRTTGGRNERYWNVVYERIGSWLVGDYLELCRNMGKSQITTTTGSLFPRVRDLLVIDYAARNINFHDRRQLDEHLHEHLRALALRA